MNQFTVSKKFGDKLEKDIALRVIEKLYPGCQIKSPDDAGIFREDGLAIPDHIVVKNKKIIALYDSKNKNNLYTHHGHTEKFWSTDEKLFEYRKISDKYGAPCHLLFYNKDNDKDNVYMVDVKVSPKFHKKIENEYGDNWYGYYLSQTKAYPIGSKHTENIRDEDLHKVWNAKSVEDKKTELLKILNRCRPEQSHKPMDPKKIDYWQSNISKMTKPSQLDSAVTNLKFAGEGMSLGSKTYKDRIDYA